MQLYYLKETAAIKMLYITVVVQSMPSMIHPSCYILSAFILISNFCSTYMNVPSNSPVELTVLVVDGHRVRDFLRDILVPVTKDIVETVTVLPEYV